MHLVRSHTPLARGWQAAEKQARKRAKADSSLLFDVGARVKKAEQFHRGDTALMMAARVSPQTGYVACLRRAARH